MEKQKNLLTRRDLLLFLNQFRVHSIKKLLGKLTLDGKQCGVRFLAIQEQKKRDIVEDKCLIFQLESRVVVKNYEAMEIQIPFDNGNLSVIGEDLKHLGNDLYQINFRCKNFTLLNRRVHDRNEEPHSQYSMIGVKFHDESSTIAMAKIIDSDPNTISIEMVLEGELTADKLRNAQVQFLANHNTSQNSLLSIVKVYNPKIITEDFGERKTAKVVLKKEEIVNSSKKSIVGHLNSNAQHQAILTILDLDTSEIEIQIRDVFADGFTADFESNYDSLIVPETFIAKINNVSVKFSCRVEKNKQKSHILANLIGKSLGDRIHWANYISEKYFSVKTSLRKVNPMSILELAIMAGFQSTKQLSFLLPLIGHFSKVYKTDMERPRTRLRWLKLGEQNQVLGNYSGMRISSTLWVTADNVVSYSFGGSWMKDYVQEWTDIFCAAIEGYDDQKILLGFSPSAGVWNAFDEDLKNSKDLLISKDRFWQTSLIDIGTSSPLKNDIFELNKIPHPEELGWEEYAKFGIRQTEFVKAISEGTRGIENSEFQNNFIEEFNQPLVRYFFEVLKNKKRVFLLTFTDYPFWAGINRAQNPAVLFDLGVMENISELDEKALIAAVRSTMCSLQCFPFVLIVGSTHLKMKSGFEYFQLILNRKGLLESTKSFRSA